MKSRHAAFVIAASLTGCQIDDADLDEAALTSFTLTPAATTTDRFSMTYAGEMTAGFTSNRPATLVVKVDGQPVVQQAIDLSTELSQPIEITVPLAAEGPNEVSAAVEYQGATLSQDSTIIVTMAAPTITVPTFTQTFTPHVGLDATGTIQVTAAAGYAVDEVATSVDGGPWQPAMSDGNDGWDVDLVNPDIGDVDVAVRAVLSIDGHEAATIVHQTMHVDPVFDCDAAASMLPDTTLLTGGNASGENRIMAGYFGQPGQGHDVSFVLTGQATALPGDPVVTVVSQTVDYGTTQVHAAFNTGPLRCADNGGNSCDTPYNLTATVDGVQLCTTTANGGTFGVVRRFL